MNWSKLNSLINGTYINITINSQAVFIPLLRYDVVHCLCYMMYICKIKTSYWRDVLRNEIKPSVFHINLHVPVVLYTYHFCCIHNWMVFHVCLIMDHMFMLVSFIIIYLKWGKSCLLSGVRELGLYAFKILQHPCQWVKKLQHLSPFFRKYTYVQLFYIEVKTITLLISCPSYFGNKWLLPERHVSLSFVQTS